MSGTANKENKENLNEENLITNNDCELRQRLDKFVVDTRQKIFEIAHWEDLIDMKNKTAKEADVKKEKMGEKLGLKLEPKILLEYLGSYRKLIIEIIIKYASKGIKDSYEGESKEAPIIADAFGSTNITSDYDLTLSGPGTYKIVQMIHNFWKKNSPNTNMTTSFDSNFYLVPNMVLKKKDNPLTKLGVKLMDTKSDKINPESQWAKYIPVPDDFIILELEKKALKEKLNDNFKPDNIQKVDKKYRDLFKDAEILDKHLYIENNDSVIKFNNKKNEQAKLAFFRHIMKMMKNSIEGYYCLSTILAIVYGIQAGKEKEIEKEFKDYKKGWLIAAIENLIDLYKHLKGKHKTSEAAEKEQLDDGDGHNDGLGPNILLKISKYIYRIYFCLDKYFPNNATIQEYKKKAKALVDKRSSSDTTFKEAFKEINDTFFKKFTDSVEWENYVEVFLPDDLLNDDSAKIIVKGITENKVGGGKKKSRRKRKKKRKRTRKKRRR